MINTHFLHKAHRKELVDSILDFSISQTSLRETLEKQMRNELDSDNTNYQTVGSLANNIEVIQFSSTSFYLSRTNKEELAKMSDSELIGSLKRNVIDLAINKPTPNNFNENTIQSYKEVIVYISSILYNVGIAINPDEDEIEHELNLHSLNFNDFSLDVIKNEYNKSLKETESLLLILEQSLAVTAESLLLKSDFDGLLSLIHI